MLRELISIILLLPLYQNHQLLLPASPIPSPSIHVQAFPVLKKKEETPYSAVNSLPNTLKQFISANSAASHSSPHGSVAFAPTTTLHFSQSWMSVHPQCHQPFPRPPFPRVLHSVWQYRASHSFWDTLCLHNMTPPLTPLASPVSGIPEAMWSRKPPSQTPPESLTPKMVK